MSSATPTALSTSIEACHSTLDTTCTLLNRYIRNASLFKSHLHHLITLLNRVWSELNKTNPKTGKIRSQQEAIRAVSRRLADLADGTARGRQIGQQDPDVKASAIFEVDVMHARQMHLMVRLKELAHMTRGGMEEDIQRMRTGVTRDGSSLGEVEFDEGAAKVWGVLTKKMDGGREYVEGQMERLEKDRKTVLEVLGLCGVETEEGGYYPDVSEPNFSRRVETITGGDNLEKIHELVFGIDMAFEHDGFLMTLTKDPTGLVADPWTES